MEQIADQFFRALGYLFIAGVVSVIFKFAHNNASGGKFKQVLWKGFLVCTVISLFFSLTLGRPSCEEEWLDPVFEHCTYYTDDGFEPTIEERVGAFVFFLTFLYIPVIFGAFTARY